MVAHEFVKIRCQVIEATMNRGHFVHSFKALIRFGYDLLENKDFTKGTNDEGDSTLALSNSF
jgi:hypothetical protein